LPDSGTGQRMIIDDKNGTDGFWFGLDHGSKH